MVFDFEIRDYLVTASKGRSIKTWDVQQKIVVKTLTGYRCILELGNILLASCSFDCSIKIWNLKTGTCISTLFEKAYINCIELISHHLLTSGGGDKQI